MATPLEWLKHVRNVCLAEDPQLETLIGVDRVTLPPTLAFYTGHLSTIATPIFPCVTLYFPHKTDITHITPLDGTMHVDVWTPDSPNGEGRAVGKSGLWDIYDRGAYKSGLKPLLHRAHWPPPSRFTNSKFVLYQCEEMNVEDDMFEEPHHLYHLSALYRIEVRMTGLGAVYLP